MCGMIKKHTKTTLTAHFVGFRNFDPVNVKHLLADRQSTFVKPTFCTLTTEHNLKEFLFPA